MFVFSLPAAAQNGYETNQLMSRLNQLDNQIQTLSRAVYKGDMSGAAALQQGSAPDAATAGGYEARMSALEDQQRKLTGQLEKITYDIQQVKDRLEKMQADNDQRFQHMESNAAGANSVVAPAPTPAPAPAGETPAPQGTLGSYSANPSAGSNGPAEVLYESAFSAVRDSKYPDAEAKFRQFLGQYPGHPLAANAQYWLGETYYVRGDYKQAAKTFAQGYQDYPKSSKAEDSLYKLAMSLSKLGNKDDACLSLRQMQKVFASDTGPLHQKGQDAIKQLACP